jgi:hypothetical protein
MWPVNYWPTDYWQDDYWPDLPSGSISFLDLGYWPDYWLTYWALRYWPIYGEETPPPPVVEGSPGSPPGPGYRKPIPIKRVGPQYNLPRNMPPRIIIP